MTQASTWTAIADRVTLDAVAEALAANGMTAHVVEDRDEAVARSLSLIGDGQEVMTATSETLEVIGLAALIDASPKVTSVRRRIAELDQSEQRAQMRRLTSAADVVIGSVHALTRDGQALIVSNSGSQLGMYAFTAARVIWVVGAQKIVPDIEAARKRVEEHVFPLEDQRMQKAYGMPSSISKELVVSREIVPDRIHVVLVNEFLGF